jgi:two-component system cell cycle response regulator CpdR
MNVLLNPLSNRDKLDESSQVVLQVQEFSTSARILVVDDETAVRSLVAAILMRAGFAVEVAADAETAIAAFDRQTFDLLLSDIRMPGANGHELAQHVAGQYPLTRTALMTGYDESCLGCPYAPRCQVIQKPFRPAELVEFVRGILSAPADAAPPFPVSRIA